MLWPDKQRDGCGCFIFIVGYGSISNMDLVKSMCCCNM